MKRASTLMPVGGKILLSSEKPRGLLSTVTSVVPYYRRAVQEFSSNLISSVGDKRSAKYDRVFVQYKI